MSLALWDNPSLTAAECDRLAACERVIKRGLATFVEVGTALLEIRDGRLYRAQFGTFEDYCREQWQMTRQHANRTIAAAEVAARLEPLGSTPQSERHARPLASLPPEQQPEVWRKVIEAAPNGKFTAADVERAVEEYRAPAPAPAPAAPDRMAVHYSSESPEWYTPPEIIGATLGLLGTIDLDPCSNPGIPNVPATHWFTAEQDGLSREWFGSVYMNPPYGDAIPAWVEKLCGEHSACRVPEAVALVPARVETRWFRRFRDFPRCFPDGRLRFSGHENSAPFPSAVIYLGDRLDAFAAAFGALGDIFLRVEGDDASLR